MRHLEVVVDMTEDDVKDCGVSKKGHLRKFMKCIGNLKQREEQKPHQKRKEKQKQSEVEEVCQEQDDEEEEGKVTPYIAR